MDSQRKLVKKRSFRWLSILLFRLVKEAHKKTPVSVLTTRDWSIYIKYVYARLLAIVRQLLSLELADEVEVLLHLCLGIVHIDIE